MAVGRTGTFPWNVTFAYVANRGSSNVLGYTINRATGALTEIPDDPRTEKPDGSPFPTGGLSNSVAVDPSGKFAYVVNWGYVLGYKINLITGKLTYIGSVEQRQGPWSVAVDRSGNFAYVTNPNSQNVSGYRIDPDTGALTTIADSPFPAGRRPSSVAAWPRFNIFHWFLFKLRCSDWNSGPSPRASPQGKRHAKGRIDIALIFRP